MSDVKIGKFQIRAEHDTFTITIERVQKHMSNADRIRNMTDEELAEFLDKSVNGNREDWEPIGCHGCVYLGTHHQDKDGGSYECEGCDFENGILAWIQSEVKEGAENGEP